MYSQRSDAWAAPSALSVLSWLAARTTRVRLGTGVLLAPAWHPLRLAYEAAAVDQLSGGRLVVGVGAGTPALSGWFSNEAPTGRIMDELHDAVTSGRRIGGGGCAARSCARRLVRRDQPPAERASSASHRQVSPARGCL
ncbi:LLM class flavin-dependent oxidoreductase [Nocardioides sp. NPDC006273]|uniref:LLM class flavin-dependent oxidoreductase n=1 Tax=Nocardioides sp. NPDC006273 TaxID=3155598 RepID=UPI0033B50408